jgi:hypothetical protein|tara:strand:- start:739 stop:864 length:126 start_codon:yes stop_codon:yes gene_type:complete
VIGRTVDLTVHIRPAAARQQVTPALGVTPPDDSGDAPDTLV